MCGFLQVWTLRLFSLEDMYQKEEGQTVHIVLPQNSILFLVILRRVLNRSHIYTDYMDV